MREEKDNDAYAEDWRPVPRHERRTAKLKDGELVRQKKHRNGRWWALALVALLLVVVVGGFLYFRNVVKNVSDFGKSVYKETNATKLRNADAQLENEEPITILIEGLDSGALFYKNVTSTRSDVMILMAINPKTKQATLVNIPRDTLAPLGTTDDFDKINHAYQNGGIEESIESLQRLLDVPIDYYVTVNMQAFIDIIDGIGGVELTPDYSFELDGSSFTEGQTDTFGGVDAINYVRERKSDPHGDVGRGKRQQEVIQAVIDKAISWDTITNYDKILKKLDGKLYTNLTVPDMIQLQQKYIGAIRHPKRVTAEDYQDLNLPFGYYLLLPETERLRFSNLLRETLGLPQSESAVLYPADYGVGNVRYAETVDQNGDGVITDADMLVPAGIYTVDELKKDFEDAGIALDLSWRPEREAASDD